MCEVQLRGQVAEGTWHTTGGTGEFAHSSASGTARGTSSATPRPRSCDPTFGPILALGLGGMWAEVLQDVALRGLPVVGADVVEMVDELRGGRVLRGSRGRTPVDLDALIRLVVTLSEVALACGPALSAIDLNPVVVTSDGGLTILDGGVFPDPEAQVHTSRSDPIAS